jgi:CRP-like cAMP-binding protein
MASNHFWPELGEPMTLPTDPLHLKPTTPINEGIDACLLARYVPLDALSPVKRHTLAQKAEYGLVRPGSFLFKSGDPARRAYFLLSGEVGLLDGDGVQVQRIVAGSPIARQWLAHVSPRKLSARAVTIVRYFSIDASLLDVLLGADLSSECVIEELGTTNIGTEGDWMGRLSRLPGSHLIPAENLSHLFQRINDVTYEKDQFVFRQGDNPDFFYVIKSGRCALLRNPDRDPLRLAELQAGDVFGQDAIIAGTQRTAAALMLTSGTIGRVAARDFRQLVEPHLLRKLSAVDADKRVREGVAVCLDVRLPSEYQQQHVPGSMHIPLGLLRARMRNLNTEQSYVVCCDTGQRSAVAAFILRGWGFDAYAVIGGHRALRARAEPQSAPAAPTIRRADFRMLLRDR